MHRLGCCPLSPCPFPLVGKGRPAGGRGRVVLATSLPLSYILHLACSLRSRPLRSRGASKRRWQHHPRGRFACLRRGTSKMHTCKDKVMMIKNSSMYQYFIKYPQLYHPKFPRIKYLPKHNMLIFNRLQAVCNFILAYVAPLTWP